MLQAGLDLAKLRTDMLNGARFLKGHKLSSGKLGVTGFCWGGSTTNSLVTVLGADLQAGVPFYGAAAATAATINMMWPAFEAALKSAGVPHEMQMYPGIQHGFHNNSVPRDNGAAAKLAWERTIAFCEKDLA
jgi:carboxymethylenebutenolidase